MKAKERRRENGETGAERGGSWRATSQTPFSPQRLSATCHLPEDPLLQNMATVPPTTGQTGGSKCQYFF